MNTAKHWRLLDAQVSTTRLRIYCVIILLPVMLALQACGGKVEHRWKEEVLLHDGSYVWVDRHIDRHASGFPNSDVGSPITEEFRYEPMGVKWNSAWSSSQPIEQPLAFDVIGGKAFLIVTTRPLDMVCTKNTPPGTYAANYYVWEGGVMRKVTPHEVPLAAMLVNLESSDLGVRGQPDPLRISWQMKANSAGSNFATLQSIDKFFSRVDLLLRCP